jgi:alanyl-tRNA synthetase
VPQAAVDGAGLRADEWMLAALEPIGGRGGGKANAAQGQATDSLQMETAARAAAEFVRARGLN